MLLAVCLVACTNIDDLEDDVDALKKRVTALETQVRDINSNTEALRELYNEGTFITNIEEKSDSYTLTLSNGKTVNLYMKNDNNLLCPIIGIDSEGYWTVLYNKNETPERLTVNGQPVKANGESGKTPTFNVDSEGYWQGITELNKQNDIKTMNIYTKKELLTKSAQLVTVPLRQKTKTSRV